MRKDLCGRRAATGARLPHFIPVCRRGMAGLRELFVSLRRMTVIRLTKEFRFEAAHALDGYDGPCREVHGHSYRLFVTVKGVPRQDERSPKCGMVMDFGDLKRLVHEQVLSRLDHAFLMRRTPANEALLEPLKKRFDRLVLVDYQPTCENMLADFARRLSAGLPEGVALHALKLHETAASYAEWYADDNADRI